jgi:hypothetical protein
MGDGMLIDWTTINFSISHNLVCHQILFLAQNITKKDKLDAMMAICCDQPCATTSAGATMPV